MKISLKEQNIFIILFFVFLLFIPILDNIFQFLPIKNIFEKRVLKSAPQKISQISDLKNFIKDFEQYYNDNYGSRKTLIWLNSNISDKIFNESPNERVVIGKKSWLFFDNKNSMLDAQGLAKIDNKKLEKAAKKFIENWQEATARNIKYLLVIAADKVNIYPEFLPDYIEYSEKNHRIDKFISILKQENKDFPILDLRPIMKKAKNSEIIYHKTDTHWNRRGAHYGYKEIMKKLNLSYNDRDKFLEIEREGFIGDISNLMNLNLSNIDYDLSAKFVKNGNRIKVSQEIKDIFYKPQIFINNNKKLPVLFVYKDSFFDNMLDFFAQNFSISYFVNEFPCEINFNKIKNYDSNILIQQFWENRIEDIIDKCE